ncbi:MAG: hypothetical protein PHF25_07420 [Candidatus Margulisbacteria bacterium]|nr:hypothetical protein [Candidatus Margulisiibacteriota bacterium]
MELTLKNKLDFLWQDFVAYIDQGIKEGKFTDEFKDNFRELTTKDVSSVKNKGENMPAMKSPEELITGKVTLTLRDVAVLLDAGLDDFVEGNFHGFMLMMEQYKDHQDSAVFNQVNASMMELTGNHYMPYLSEKGKRAFCDKPAEYAKVLPVGLKCEPYYYDFAKKQLAWREDTAFKGEVPTKAEIIKKVVEAENERLRDIAMLMVNVDNLKIIGFNEFLV